MDDLIVDSLPLQRQTSNKNRSPDYVAPYAVPGCAWGAGIPFSLLLVALGAGTDWAKHTILAPIWPYLIGFCVLVLVPCITIIAWNLRKAKKYQDDQENKRRKEQ